MLVGAFSQEKALVGAFSVIVKTGCGTDGSIYSTTFYSHICLAVARIPRVIVACVEHMNGSRVFTTRRRNDIPFIIFGFFTSCHPGGISLLSCLVTSSNPSFTVTSWRGGGPESPEQHVHCVTLIRSTQHQ